MEHPTVMKREGRYEHNVQFIDSLKNLYFGMKFCGIWPQAHSQYWHNLAWYIQSMVMLFHIVGLVLGVLMQQHDIKEIIDIVAILIPAATVAVKWVIFSTHKITVEKLFYYMEQDWINLEKNTSIYQSVPDSKKIMALCSRLAKMYLYVYATMAVLIIIGFIRDAIELRISYDIGTDLDKFLPIPHTWYPVDYNRVTIEILALVQIIAVISSLLVNVMMDCIFITVSSYLCGQFKILGHFIESITYDSSRPEYGKTQIVLLVERHQVLLGVGQLLQDSYSLIILEQFMCCTIGICFLGYVIIAEIEKNNVDRAYLFKIGSGAGTTLQMIFWYCLAGDFLTEYSNAITRAVYNAKWYDFTHSMSISFLLVAIRSGTPVEITGAGIMQVSLGSFMALMKSSASYLSVLRAMDVGEG